MEQQIKLASKLYRCRDTIKRFYMDDYNDKLQPYKECIRKYAAKSGKDILLSAMEICEVDEIREKGGFIIMMFLAAALEMVEPSE